MTFWNHHGDLGNKLKNIMSMTDFSDQFKYIFTRDKRLGYKLNVMRHSACLILTHSQFFILKLHVGWSFVRIYMAPTKNYLVKLVGPGSFLSIALPTGVQLVILLDFRFAVVLFDF